MKPDISGLLKIWGNLDEYKTIARVIENQEGPCFCSGVVDHAVHSMIAALMSEKNNKTAIVISNNELSARKTYEALDAILDGVYYLPPRDIQLSAVFAGGNEINNKRLKVLNAITKGDARIIVLSGGAAIQKMVPPEVFLSCSFELEVGKTIDNQEILKKLTSYGYERVRKVEAAGQFRIAGGIVDIFVSGEDNPFRMELFDDEIDSIREFDTLTQRSLIKKEKVFISPANEVPIIEEARKRAIENLNSEQKNAGLIAKERIEGLLSDIESGYSISGIEDILPYFYEGSNIVDFFPKDTIVFLSEGRRVEENIEVAEELFAEKLSQALEDQNALKMQENLIFAKGELFQYFQTGKTVEFASLGRHLREISPKALVDFTLLTVSNYNGKLNMLAADIKDMKKGVSVVICAGDMYENVQQALDDFGIENVFIKGYPDKKAYAGKTIITDCKIKNGFEIPSLKFVLIGNEDLFGTQTRKTKRKPKKRENKLDLFSELKIGDFVVHESHGIGRFLGIETHTFSGKSRDFLVIQYRGSDRVGVSTDELDRVQKYIGTGERAPKLSKIGGGEWEKSVNKTKSTLKALAFDLLELYAKRQSTKGYMFSPDTQWQKQMEDSFQHIETDGQITALEEIKGDMQSSKVMDRLLCADVGYGKTEVALRAAFKAIQDSKQVVFLAPTTILAQQHFITFRNRLSEFPVKIVQLSRLRSNKEIKESIKLIEKGQADLIVGTHRILGDDVQFKDLGLLIVDEEQRFGVGDKEKIKNKSKNVDVLSLSATPIPRTLHMSLSGIRDLSVIDTPPEERYPVQTYVIEYSESVVKEAILKEVSHGGQVYFLYNNVKNILSMKRKLEELLEDVNIGVAHGQMPQSQLENTMIDFIDKKIDVLLCSTIIESGLDIANANTIIVYDADKYGLSQLYQLRGRVGRSNRMAYSYLTVKPDKSLSEIAEKRLRTLKEFTEFGSGFKISMRDLEIRGAGDVLGAMQHGHLNEVGYDLYIKLLDQAIKQAKGEEIVEEIQTKIELPIDAHIPVDYIEDESMRLEIYKRIALVDNSEEYYDVQEEIEDRFGDIPQSIHNLLDIALLKAAAQRVGINLINSKNNAIRIQMSEQFKPKIELLISVIEKNKGLKLLPGSGTTLEFRQNNATIEYMFHKVKQIIDTFDSCI